MQITASAISLNVDDPEASAAFAADHLGFEREMAADGFVSLSRPDAGFNLIFLRTGLESFKPAALAGHRADGLLVAFVVDDVAQYGYYREQGYFAGYPADPTELGDALDPASPPPPGLRVFVPLGLALEDVAVAAELHRRAVETGAGRELPL